MSDGLNKFIGRTRYPLATIPPIERECYSFFGSSNIKQYYDHLSCSTRFVLPNGVVVLVPDEVAAQERLNWEPEGNLAYASLASIIIRSRL